MTTPETHDPIDTFRDDLRTIRDLWPDMLPRLNTSSVARFIDSGGRTSTPKAEDNGDHNTDVDNLDIVLSARGDITAILNGWCTLTLEDFNLTTTNLNRHNVPDMCEFLNRWASHLAKHDAWNELTEEIRDAARLVQRTAHPPIRDSILIGHCPVTIADHGEQIVCGTPIRVRNGEPIRCRGCGKEDTFDWWVTAMTDNQPVTADQLIPLLHRRLGIKVDRVTIRVWVSRKVIQPITTRDPDGRPLFDQHQVFAALMQREARRERA